MFCYLALRRIVVVDVLVPQSFQSNEDPLLRKSSRILIPLVFCAIVMLQTRNQEPKQDLAVVLPRLPRFPSVVNVRIKEFRIVEKLERMANEFVKKNVLSMIKMPLIVNHLKEYLAMVTNQEIKPRECIQITHQERWDLGQMDYLMLIL